MAKIYLDDVRVPPPWDESEWLVVRNYEGFVALIKQIGIPDWISFDHDLGYGEKTGYDCALYIVKNDLPLKGWGIHSSNPIGAEKIDRLLKDYEQGIKPVDLIFDSLTPPTPNQ